MIRTQTDREQAMIGRQAESIHGPQAGRGHAVR
jgi:hypothetical protein